MKHAQKESIIHILILVLVQWISLAIVILNTAALYILRSPELDRHLELSDYIFLILGAISFIASTVMLVFYLYISYRLTDNHIFSPPRYLSITEAIFGLLSIILWVLVTVLMLTRLQGLSRPCQLNKQYITFYHNDVCELFDTIIILAFVNLGGWLLDFLSAFFVLLRSPDVPTAIFTIEAPPQRFSHPLITPLDSILFDKSTNKASPNTPPKLIVTSPSTKSSSVNEESIKSSIDEEKNNKNTLICYPDQYLLHPDSYLTATQILQPIPLELPNIQPGISQIDINFIDYGNGSSSIGQSPRAQY